MAALVARGKEAMFDAEHFFDGYKANSAYADALPEGGLRRRARVGRAVRHQWRHAALRVYRIVREVTRRFPGDKLGIHTHNDTENAVANTLARSRPASVRSRAR
jgi:2-isopropylmalate synthase